MLYFTETHKEGYYSTGDVLFTSKTNNVDVKFTSDYSVTWSGFRLNIRSISCADCDNFPQTVVNTASTTVDYSPHSPVHPSETPNSCDAQEVQIAAEQVLQGALITNTENDGNYPNNACQNWNIIANENQVNMLFFQGNNAYLFYYNTINNYILLFKEINIPVS